MPSLAPLTIPDVIRLMMTRAAQEGRFPFVVELPNRTTTLAIAEMAIGKAERFESVASLIRKLARNQGEAMCY